MSTQKKNGRFDRQVYANCDIIFPPYLLERIEAVLPTRYLIVGQRINLNEGVLVDFAEHDWGGGVKRLFANGQCSLYPVSGMDYFIFPRGLWAQLPPLIVGRGGYDGALVAFCLRSNIPIIDATTELPVLHQYHDYAHIVGGFKEAHMGDEARQNYALHDVRRSTPTTADADFVLKDRKLIAHKCRGDSLRALELFIRYRLRLRSLSLGVRAIWRLLQETRCISPKEFSLEKFLREVR